MKPKPLTEKAIQIGIMQALGYKGWRVIKMPPSIYTSGKGIPDLLCMNWGVTVWIEVKTEKGKLSPTQEKMGNMITDAGGLYIVAKTVDFAVMCLENIQLEIGWNQYLVPSKDWRLTVEGKS